MSWQSRLIATAAEHSPWRAGFEPTDSVGTGLENEQHDEEALGQYRQRVRRGMAVELPELWGRRVLEIGCGHGGVSCYLAGLGPKIVVGVDVDPVRLAAARRLHQRIERAAGGSLPVSFVQTDGSLPFPDVSFDVVIADNFFEHVMEPEACLAGINQLLATDGELVVPGFSSIDSKWALHLKRGLPLPWLNHAFSDATIIEALDIRAKRHPWIHACYPGLEASPRAIRDLRASKDLNDITYASFKTMAQDAGLSIDTFRVHLTRGGRLLRLARPSFESSRLAEVLSTGASAVLRRTQV